MKIAFISDTHSDHLLTSGTTLQSRLALRWLRHAATIQGLKTALTKGADLVVHAGDLFDGVAAKDGTGLLNALEVGWYCDYILAGNHDVPKNATKLSMFEALHRANSFKSPRAACLTKFGEAKVVALTDDVIAIPHVATQTLFKEAINQALNLYGGKGMVLVLHCNIRLSEHVANESTLNLDQAMMGEVSQAFKRVIVGHTHQHFTAKADKIISVGTPYPISFADWSEQVRSNFGLLLYDTEKDSVEQIVTCPLTNLIAVNASQIMSREEPLPVFVSLLMDTVEISKADLVGKCMSLGAKAIKWVTALEDGLGSEEEATTSAVGEIDVISKVLSLLPENVAKEITERFPACD